MAKFECKCGKLLSNTEVPNEIEYHVYDDYEWDNIFKNDTINVLEIPRPKFDVWKCPQCERIYLFKEKKVHKIYCLE